MEKNQAQCSTGVMSALKGLLAVDVLGLLVCLGYQANDGEFLILEIAFECLKTLLILSILLLAG